jgi:sterol desaturase/sphingolipid hydroxylase (fatty acid hydroxylase superfamily)
MKILVAFLALFVIFGLLEKLYPLHKQQKIWRRHWFTDVTHFFVNHFLVNIGTYVVAAFFYILLFPSIPFAFHIAVRSQPGFIQFIEAFTIAQICFYIVHRLSHKIPYLWRFHAIHHSSTELDWLASARLHPLDVILANIAVGVPLFLLGFTRETFGAYLIFSTILPIFNHANTRLRFPILRLIIATPEFHHWHHSNDLAACNKNFSGSPLVDYLFGTCYLPRDKTPETYGVDEVIPNSYWQHLAFPFHQKP